MFPIYQLIPMILQGMASIIFSWIFWLIVLLVAMQYKRLTKVGSFLFDLPREPLWPSVLFATLFGMAGGVLGSILLVVVGISLFEVGIIYLWITALVLMLFRQRFLCFAYAGGVISLVRIIFGVPDVSVPQIMGLVAILHMVESFLILGSAHLQPVPVYARTKQGRIVGGFNLQKFWPLPIVALMAVTLPDSGVVQGGVAMPDWWPLIKPEYLQGTGDPVYYMLPVVAALGYGDIALTDLPRYKTRRSALDLGLYSVILLFLAIMASYRPETAIIPALFGPLGHETLILLGQRREMGGQPYFVPPMQGVMLLHVLRGMPFRRAGLKDGDIILAVNGIAVHYEREIRELLLLSGGSVKVELLRGRKQSRLRKTVYFKTGENPGYIPVPEGQYDPYVEFSGSTGLLKKWLKKLKG